MRSPLGEYKGRGQLTMGGFPRGRYFVPLVLIISEISGITRVSFALAVECETHPQAYVIEMPKRPDSELKTKAAMLDDYTIKRGKSGINEVGMKTLAFRLVGNGSL